MPPRQQPHARSARAGASLYYINPSLKPSTLIIIFVNFIKNNVGLHVSHLPVVHIRGLLGVPNVGCLNRNFRSVFERTRSERNAQARSRRRGDQYFTVVVHQRSAYFRRVECRDGWCRLARSAGAGCERCRVAGAPQGCYAGSVRLKPDRRTSDRDEGSRPARSLRTHQGRGRAARPP